MAEQNVTKLAGKARTESGKGISRRLRAAGQVPAVLYGPHSKAPMHLSVDPLALKAAIQTPYKFNTLLTIEIEGQPARTALVKDIQVDVVDRNVLHADFIEVRTDEKVTVRVPVILTGRPLGAGDGGILNQVSRELLVSVLPKEIPLKLEIDVSPLKIGDALHVSDIKFPAGVVAKTKADVTVAVCAAPEREEVAAVADPATAAAAPAAAGAKAGDAKAADAKADPKAADAKGADAKKAAPAAKK